VEVKGWWRTGGVSGKLVEGWWRWRTGGGLVEGWWR